MERELFCSPEDDDGELAAFAAQEPAHLPVRKALYFAVVDRFDDVAGTQTDAVRRAIVADFANHDFAVVAGNGDFLDDEMSEDPGLVKHCAAAFEAVWERAIDHADYRPA